MCVHIEMKMCSSNGLSLHDARHTDIYFMTVYNSGESGMKFINPLATSISFLEVNNSVSMEYSFKTQGKQ